MTFSETCPICDAHWPIMARKCASCGTDESELTAVASRISVELDTESERDEMNAPRCPACGGSPTFLGQLGKRTHYRCRDCGTDYSTKGNSIPEILHEEGVTGSVQKTAIACRNCGDWLTPNDRKCVNCGTPRPYPEEDAGVEDRFRQEDERARNREVTRNFERGKGFHGSVEKEAASECPSCGTPLSSSERICPVCGYDVASMAPAESFPGVDADHPLKGRQVAHIEEPCESCGSVERLGFTRLCHKCETEGEDPRLSQSFYADKRDEVVDHEETEPKSFGDILTEMKNDFRAVTEHEDEYHARAKQEAPAAEEAKQGAKTAEVYQSVNCPYCGHMQDMSMDSFRTHCESCGNPLQERLEDYEPYEPADYSGYGEDNPLRGRRVADIHERVRDEYSADHTHECRRCGSSIPCNGDGKNCWEGDNDRCPNCGSGKRSSKNAAEDTTYEDPYVRVYHTNLGGNLVAERKRDGAINALWDDPEELHYWAREGKPDPEHGFSDFPEKNSSKEAAGEMGRCAWCGREATHQHDMFGYCDKHYEQLQNELQEKKTGAESWIPTPDEIDSLRQSLAKEMAALAQLSLAEQKKAVHYDEDLEQNVPEEGDMLKADGIPVGEFNEEYDFGFRDAARKKEALNYTADGLKIVDGFDVISSDDDEETDERGQQKDEDDALYQPYGDLVDLFSQAKTAVDEFFEAEGIDAVEPPLSLDETKPLDYHLQDQETEPPLFY